jgi:hypothetical protein
MKLLAGGLGRERRNAWERGRTGSEEEFFVFSRIEFTE